MMELNNKVDCEKMTLRKAIAQAFYQAVLSPDETPLVVTDHACLEDFFLGDLDELTVKISEKYGVQVKREQFKAPFWQLLDYLHAA